MLYSLSICFSLSLNLSYSLFFSVYLSRTLLLSYICLSHCVCFYLFISLSQTHTHPSKTPQKRSIKCITLTLIFFKQKKSKGILGFMFKTELHWMWQGYFQNFSWAQKKLKQNNFLPWTALVQDYILFRGPLSKLLQLYFLKNLSPAWVSDLPVIQTWHVCSYNLQTLIQ